MGKKSREKQKQHLACGMTKEERLAKEAAEEEAREVTRKEEEEQRRSEEISLYDICGIKDPTPYEAYKRNRRNVYLALHARNSNGKRRAYARV